MGILITIVLVAAGMWLVIAAVTFVQVRALGTASLAPYTPQEGGADTRIQATGHSHQWAQDNGFAFVGWFVMPGQPALIAAWQHADQPTFFCQYFVRGQTTCDFATELAEEVSLTTGSTKDGQLFPCPPGHYKQTFTGLGLDQQWARHAEGVKYLADVGRARPASLDEPFEEVFVDAVRKEMAFIRGIPLWPLRAPYWYFVRRHLWHNRSIQSQHDKLAVALPNELAGGM